MPLSLLKSQAVSLTVAPLKIKCLILWLLLRFLFASGFQQFYYDVPRCSLLWIFPGVYRASLIWNLIISVSFGKFSANFSSNIAFAPFSFLSPSELQVLVHKTFTQYSICLSYSFLYSPSFCLSMLQSGFFFF